MDLVDKLIDFFSQPEEKTQDKTPEGVCPVCWGYQEYDKKIRILYNDKQIDVNNHKARYTLIRDFTKKYVDGIKLKKGETIECPTCNSQKTKRKPIKRNETLQLLSRDHHHGLLLSWKIRAGIKNEISLERIKNYCNFFYKEELIAHFNLEEQYLFTILDKNDPDIKKALSEHRKLKKLFKEETIQLKNIMAIEEELEKHIRFEERVLFNKIEKVATPQQLEKIAEIHSSAANEKLETWEDKFWEK
jgi:hypothetical protein